MESYAMKVASPDDIVELTETCPMCRKPDSGKVRMITAEIPLFKEIVVMAYTCDNCGYRNSEIKPSGDVSPTGRIYKLRVERPEDLSRDVLKVRSLFCFFSLTLYLYLYLSLCLSVCLSHSLSIYLFVYRICIYYIYIYISPTLLSPTQLSCACPSSTLRLQLGRWVASSRL